MVVHFVLCMLIEQPNSLRAAAPFVCLNAKRYFSYMSPEQLAAQGSRSWACHFVGHMWAEKGKRRHSSPDTLTG